MKLMITATVGKFKDGDWEGYNLHILRSAMHKTVCKIAIISMNWEQIDVCD